MKVGRMNGNNILGGIFLSLFPICYLLSMVSVGGFSDNYVEFCKKVECPNTENLGFDPNEVYKKAQLTAVIGAFSVLGLIWILFYLKDRYYDNKKPLYNSNGVLIDGVEE